jgi:hypothetical protein
MLNPVEARAEAAVVALMDHLINKVVQEEQVLQDRVITVALVQSG